MSQWAPNQAGLQEILKTIHDSTDMMNIQVQRTITQVYTFIINIIIRNCPTESAYFLQKLNDFTREPEYIAYLAYILSSLPHEEDRIRSIAGYLLKNNARLIITAPPEVASFVKEAVLRAFNDPSIMIRNAASQDIVAFLGVLEPKNWPECLQHLVGSLDSTDLDKQEASSIFQHTRSAVSE
jgi:transportin-1